MKQLRRLTVVAALVTLVLVSVGAASPGVVPASASSSSGWKAIEVGLGEASDVNERGQIVGGNREDTIIWENGKPRTLPQAATPDANEYATAINDTGEVTGGTWGGVGGDRALMWQRNGALRILPPLRTKYSSEARDINNSGQIVGRSGNSAVVWESGRPHALPGRHGVARAINDRGQVIGSVGAWRAALWENGTLRILATTKSDATDINNRGQVVGWRTGAAGKVRRGFLWGSGAMVDLAGLMPEAINDRGQIVGSCSSGACVWQRGRITKLRDLGYSDAIATGINERQQIVGYAQGGGPSSLEPVVLVWTFRP